MVTATMEEVFERRKRLMKNYKVNPFQNKTHTNEVTSMTTKSRYETIAELENQKRQIILDRDNLPNTLRLKEQQLKNLRRELEDEEENLQIFKDQIKEQEATANLMIASIDDTLQKLSKS